MKTTSLYCPNCKINISISNLPENQEEWNSLQFTCSNCNHRIGLINTTQESNSIKMKKIVFTENCSNCNEINTIHALESSCGNTIKNKCFNCKTMMKVMVPVVKDIQEDNMNQDSDLKKTFINPSYKLTEKKLILQVIESDYNKEQQFVINQPHMSIGRKNGNTNSDIAIITNDLMMSRFHSVIKKNEKSNTFSIMDSGSANGTYRNEVKLQSFEDKTKNEEIVLKDGDKIRLGNTLMSVRIQ